MLKQLNIYVPAELLTRLDRLAEENERSRSATVQRMIRYYLSVVVKEKHWWPNASEDDDDPQARFPF